ncbi:RNA-guided endonuclease IscB [Ammoniphilus resinae]|uniref:RRXRR domain-containing protein n=1 Tax=Ammoniphilus resinae TaxID=861532 RepID=A0ABS4GNK4_9BACL|nr:RNA-guided endonuclease IscB [Ammoniphilus resinae]MBP1931821.1 hypothetical protein [Ammoniphilus resinae]
MVYVLNEHGRPLMPTTRYGKVRRLIQSGKAKVKGRKPFTIQLLYPTTSYTQSLTLGIDSGYENVGVSVVSEKTEVFAAECKLLTGMSERLKGRAMYRRQRRSRLRYRKPRFDNRRRSGGWLAPSIQHKLDSHLRLVEKVKRILPINQTILEVANFDIQAIRNPEIEGIIYQMGEQFGFFNLREYILHRDHHQCQYPKCRNKNPHPILQVHHVGFWKGDRSNRPRNLIALCDWCHTPQNHLSTGFLYGWEPKEKSFRPETFMSMVRWKLIALLNAKPTYGFLTKSKRILQGLEKSHATDAFVIAGGSNQSRIQSFLIRQVRRNNRSLEKFYDAKVTDIRTGRVVKGQEVFCGRRVRNRELTLENLRVYRGEKVSKGKRVVRKQRYSLQPMDLVWFDGNLYTVSGTNNKGKTVVLRDCRKVPAVSKVKLIKSGKGFCFVS